MGLGCLSLPQCLLGGSGKGKEVSRATEGPIALVLTLVWHQGISEFMAPHVSSNIRGLGCTQAGVGGGEGWSSHTGSPTPRQPWARQALHSQREAEDVASDRRSILAVVEQGQPKATLRQIYPAVRPHLKGRPKACGRLYPNALCSRSPRLNPSGHSRSFGHAIPPVCPLSVKS